CLIRSQSSGPSSSNTITFASSSLPIWNALFLVITSRVLPMPLTVGDRSGMGNTREVMTKKSAFQMGKELDAKVIVFDELGPDDWDLIKQSDTHWEQGFALPRPVRKAAGIVQTCCLKTHRYGGHFTLSLKNSV